MQLKRFVCLAVAVCLAGIITGCAKPSSGAGTAPHGTLTGEATPQLIGVYDSRSVAVAFAGSPKHEEQTATELAALKSARAEGDPQDIAKADERVWESRKRLHRQGFSTASVDNILAMYPEKIEALKSEHNITILVSKWDEQTLARFPDAQQVDITEDLVEAPGPSDRQRRSALEVRNHDPLTPAQVEKVIQQEMQ